MLRHLTIAAGVFLLAGCAAQPRLEDGSVVANLPPNYRDLIAQQVKKDYFDPYSIRDASISNPVDTTSIFGAVTNVCVKANAKNRMGGYIGVRATGYVFQSGKILNVLPDEMIATQCESRSYVPFYEIDSVAKAPVAEVSSPAAAKRRK
jgi:hypothetical protein